MFGRNNFATNFMLVFILIKLCIPIYQSYSSKQCSCLCFRLRDLHCTRTSPTQIKLSWSGGIPPFNASLTCTSSKQSSHLNERISSSTDKRNMVFNIKLTSYYTLEVICADNNVVKQDFPYRYE